MSKSKEAADKLRKVVKKREEKKAKTYGLYTIANPKSKEWPFTPPFMAVDDASALNALVELAKSHPELCRRHVYRIGSWCAVDGKLSPLREFVHVDNLKQSKRKVIEKELSYEKN